MLLETEIDTAEGPLLLIGKIGSKINSQNANKLSSGIFTSVLDFHIMFEYNSETRLFPFYQYVFFIIVLQCVFIVTCNVKP